MMHRGLLITVLVLLLVPAGSAYAAPSRTFTQELGRISPPGTIYVDLYNNTGTWTPAADSQLRVGTPLGEALLTENSLGFKAALMKNLAWHVSGRVNTASQESSDGMAGIAYQIRAPKAYVNLNPYMTRQSGLNNLHFGVALFTPLYVRHWLGELQLGAEFKTSDESEGKSGVAVGARWLPRDFVTIDVVLLADGGSEQSSTFRTPAALRVNLRF